VKSLVKVMFLLFSFPALSASSELIEVMEIEMNRAIEDLELDGEGPPWRVRLDLGEMISVDVSAEIDRKGGHTVNAVSFFEYGGSSRDPAV
jgi:hypothetical protein